MRMKDLRLAILDIATVIRLNRITSERDSERNSVYYHIDELSIVCKAYHNTLLHTIKADDRLSVTFTWLYVKAVRMMNYNAKKAYRQYVKSVSDAYTELAYHDETDNGYPTYEQVNDLLDNFVDWESDGGWKKFAEYADSMNVRISKGLANSFASHVLNNKYLLAYATFLDLKQHIENFAKVSHNYNTLRKFRSPSGKIVKKPNALSKVYISERIDNPPPDETKFMPKQKETVTLESSFKRKITKRHKENFTTYSIRMPIVHPAPESQWKTKTEFRPMKLIEPKLIPNTWFIPDGDGWTEDKSNVNPLRFRMK